MRGHKAEAIFHGALLIVFMALGWILPAADVAVSVLSFGAEPVLVMAAAQVSNGIFMAAVIVTILIYAAALAAVPGAVFRKRWLVFIGTLAMVIDLCGAIVFLALSWYFLIAAAMDIVFIMNLWRMFLK